MLRRDRQIRMQIHQLMDACLFAFTFWLAYVLRSDANVVDFLGRPPNQFRDYVWLYLILIPAAPLVLEAQGYYNRPLLCPRRDTAWQLAKACFFIVVGLILACFLFQVTAARVFIIWFGFVSFSVMLLKDELLMFRRRRLLGRSHHRRRFILVGTPEETARVRQELRRQQHDLEILAELNLHTIPLEELVARLHEYSVNGVLISTRHTYFEQVEAVIRACELEGVEAWVAADFFKTQISRTSFDDFYGYPVLVFRSTPESSWESVFKQLLDHVGALLALMVVWPFMLLFGLLIKITSPGPVFFKQQRSGLNGQPFTIYKFRTMVTNAEQIKHELAAMNEMSGPVFKVTKDPRITPIGKWLRKFSIDEWPQLFNVLRGEMSLVGPRPLPVDEVKRFNDLAHRRRLSVKPGLTCLWQISGRNNVKDFRDWVRLDLEYIDNWSLWLDIKILFRTVPVVLAGTGAK
jgi:exopolysaccharide biosynthesis polyprenyl glycosylphosphotransferase